MKNLHVFTNKFPYIDSGEDTFLIPEMTILSKDFNIIFYVKNKGNLLKNLPFEFTVCHDFKYMEKNTFKISLNLIFIILNELFLTQNLYLVNLKLKN